MSYRSNQSTKFASHFTDIFWFLSFMTSSAMRWTLNQFTISMLVHLISLFMYSDWYLLRFRTKRSISNLNSAQNLKWIAKYWILSTKKQNENETKYFFLAKNKQLLISDQKWFSILLFMHQFTDLTKCNLHVDKSEKCR